MIFQKKYSDNFWLFFLFFYKKNSLFGISWEVDGKVDGKESLHLRALGFCGIDDSVSLADLVSLSSTYPFIEWGVLFRSDKTGTPRYASEKMLADIHRYNDECRRQNLNQNSNTHLSPLRLAGHLCGNYVNQVLQGDNTFVEHLIQCGFKRVQGKHLLIQLISD